MHPTLVAALAAERHTALLRDAEQHRRARLARTVQPARRRTLSSVTSHNPGRRWQRLIDLVTVARRHAPDSCCA